MSLEALADIIFIWVSRYIAGFCLVSIAVWGTGMYLWGKDWRKKVRDAGIFLVSIGALTVVLALRPTAQADQFWLWPPLTWFSFSMLIVLELLWVAFLIEGIVRKLGAVAKPQHPTREESGYRSPYSRTLER